MQAFSHLTGMRLDRAIAKWLNARDKAVKIATEMSSEVCSVCHGEGGWNVFSGSEDGATPEVKEYVPCDECGGDGLGLNVHKQIVNRLIEPWSWITVCVTGDDGAWSNYNSLRCHPDAADDIQRPAYMAQRVYYTSTPKELKIGEWHTPYIRENEWSEITTWLSKKNGNWAPSPVQLEQSLIQISTGRCARTSYLTQEGTRDFEKDIELHDRLRFHVPLHASPFEHVCQAMGDDVRYAMYTGWKSYRQFIPREYVTDFQPNYEEYFALHPEF